MWKQQLIAELLGRKLHEDAGALTNIESFFAQRKRPMPARTRVQALVPEGALVFPNAHGTAPGLALEVRPNPFRPAGKASWLIMLPGPPRELRPMFSSQVLPLLAQNFPLREAFVCRTLKTTGLGESLVEDKIAGPLQPHFATGLEIGYCARVGEVDVRLVARGGTAKETVDQAERVIRELLGQHVFGVNEDQLESVVVRLLTERRQALAVAESCTGGYLAHRLTNVPGASTVFLGGLVTYSNEAKQDFLGVHADSWASRRAKPKCCSGSRRANPTATLGRCLAWSRSR